MILRILREKKQSIHARHLNPFSPLCANFLDLCNGLGNRSAEDTVAVCGDEQVVFDADAAKILVSFQLVVIDELLELAFGLPHIDECRDEVDARLVGDHEARLQGLAAAQSAEA